MEVTTIWLAATESNRENGCLRVLPGTQNNRLLSRKEMIDVKDGKNVMESGIHPSQIDDSRMWSTSSCKRVMSRCIIRRFIHGSEPNTSRIAGASALTLRYIPTSTRVKREDDRAILVRGLPDAGNSNQYAERPAFDPAIHMPFCGMEAWLPV